MEERVLMSAAPTQADFYFDPISPYAWLAARSLGRLEGAGVRVRFVPVLFAGLLKAHGNLGPAEVPAKRLYLFRDVMREAARRGLPFAGPPGHPFNPLTALRMCSAIGDDFERRRLALALMAACWEGGEDVSDAAVLARLADEAGFDGHALLERAATPEIKQALAAATDAAIADGVFGVPTFRLDGELFWGGDRIEALLWRLEGGTIDEEQLAAFLAREALAQRRVGTPLPTQTPA
ncbi:2-hydroxychromene-2-carboxylate isomerase [Massilia sp. 2TAF26]|uniref:2-hydroxychromene-2-carboxylate isomerase n=1 Tax=Massilia sp. 2TAF26 TaxID=3233012 RepID=UPI003F96327D